MPGFITIPYNDLDALEVRTGLNAAVQSQNTVTRIFDKNDFYSFLVSVVGTASARQV